MLEGARVHRYISYTKAALLSFLYEGGKPKRNNPATIGKTTTLVNQGKSSKNKIDLD